MVPDFPMQFVIPIGAVLAAAITAAVSFVSLVVSKEQKVSEFRQAWIDALRKEIADFASNARRISTEEWPIDLKAISGTMLETIAAHNEEVLRPDPYHTNRLQMAQAYYAIRLRLNPDEPDHTAILRGMDAVYRELASGSRSTCFEQTVAALDKLSSEAQRVLKREWTRVKDGEPRYKRAVTIAKFLGIGLALCFSVLVGYAAIRAIQ
jgi:hypothetical protein